MQVSELLEAVSIPKDEANELRAELRALLKEAGVSVEELRVDAERAIKSKGKIARTSFGGYVIPKLVKGEYDEDEAQIGLRLAHRLITKWLAAKEAAGQVVSISQHSGVGGVHLFKPEPKRLWRDGGNFNVPSFYMSFSIGRRADERAEHEKDDRLNIEVRGGNINPAKLYHFPTKPEWRRPAYSMPSHIGNHFYVEGPAADIKAIRRLLQRGQGKDTTGDIRKLHALGDELMQTFGGWSKDDVRGTVVDAHGRQMQGNYPEHKGFLPLAKLHDDDIDDSFITTSLNKTRKDMINIPYDAFMRVVKKHFPSFQGGGT